jgi:hypothetical protein
MDSFASFDGIGERHCGGEGVVAEVDAAQGPGENLVLDAVTPVPGAAVPAVEAVHDVAAVR